MSLSDPIADMLTRIRNGAKAGQLEVAMPSSKMKVGIARVLEEAGYVAWSRVEGDVKKTLTVGLKYKNLRTKDPVIEGLQRVSKPSCRQYVNSREIPRVLGGLGTAILSTSQGLMTGREARKKNVGGEVLCTVW